ncbi:possible D-alanyl-D-alanine carboxypeptidase [Geomicrobium sp. JCM 19039]|nr:possible D-alanyl-D-alanine carboxypeptidase [Geomicrobium sp. JCM 19039]
MDLIYWVLTAVVLVVLLAIIGLWRLLSWQQKPDANYVETFIRKHPARSSLLVTINGETLVEEQADEPRHLASTVKIIVAIEYAEQAANGDVDPSERIAIADLARFHIPQTDGGAHPSWLTDVEANDRLQEGAVSLEDVAKGMISHSSNANTEYLLMRLGIEQVNRHRERLGLSNHDRIVPFVSSMIIPYEVAKANDLKIFDKEDAKRIPALMDAMSSEAYEQQALTIHEKLKNDQDGSYKDNVKLHAWHNQKLDQIVSKRDTRSTVREYASIMQKINSDGYFAKEVQDHLQPVLEGWLLNNSKKRSAFTRLGGKGGSTSYIVTFALYAEDKQGNRTEVAAFFNDVLGYETIKLENSILAFQLDVVGNDARRAELVRQFGGE